MADGVFQTSFAAGELSPNLYAREDIEKYSSGAALMRNFYVDYRGGASNRPGTEFKAACFADTPTRLIPFIFSQDQSYVLELSDLHCRVYQFGVAIQDLTTPWTEDALFFLKYVQSADVLTVVHPDYPPYNISRTSLTTFVVAQVDVGPNVAPPANLTATASDAGNLRYGYCVTALTESGEESLGAFPAFCDSVALDPTNAAPKTTKQAWDAVADAKAYNVYKWGPVPNDQPMPTLFGYIGQTKTTSFTDTNIAPDYSRVPPEYRDPFSPGQVTAIEITSGGSGYVGYVELTVTGDGTGATAYAVADDTGAISGVVITNSGKNYTAATVTPASGAATFDATVDTANHYPSVVTYFQQRRVYGGADASPELLEFSQIGAYENFDVSPAVLDSDSITVNIASRQVNDIKSLVPMSTGLIVFTTGCAFLVAGAGQSSVVTPSSVSAVPQASTGSNDIEPITVNYNILFVQQKGAIVRDMAFSFQTQSYYGVDRSMLANHLFFGYNIVDWAWAEEPYKLLWVVRNDGRCLVLTYVPDQEVYGWSQHDTNGLFKSVTTVPEADQDATYFVVSRFIQETQTWKNYFERLSFRTCDCPADAAFLDSFVGVPRAIGDATLFVTLDGDTATMSTDGPSILTRYTMEAKENYPAPIADYLLAHNAFEKYTFVNNILTGLFYDAVRREIFYCAQIYYYGFTDTITNPTGFTLFGGTDNFTNDWLVAPDGDLDQSIEGTLTLCSKNIDTGVVTAYSTYDPAQTVPVGIGPGGGSDGTWRRMVVDISGSGNYPNLIDPWTSTALVHTESCELYWFRRSANYAQEINPIFPTVAPGNTTLAVGVQIDWVYVIEQTAATHNKFYVSPRLFQPDEITADYKLIYEAYDFPVVRSGAFYDFCVFDNGKCYLFNQTTTGANPYTLWEFTPPALGAYPATGGAWADVTPWGSAGPNADMTAYTTRNNGSNGQRVKQMRISSQSMLVLINSLLPADSGNTAPWRIDFTYFRPADASYTTYEALVSTYMTADWVATTDVNAAGYKLDATIIPMWTNTYRDKSSYDYGDDDSKRWLFFTVQKMVSGAPSGGTFVVLVEYHFVDGAAPVPLQVIPETTAWDLYYTDYATTIGDTHVVYASTNPGNLDFRSGLDAGVFDKAQNAFWWSGVNTMIGVNNMTYLDDLFAYRADISNTQPPLLKLTLGGTAGGAAQIGNAVDIGCGTITITGLDGTSFIGHLDAPIQHEVPDDPFHTIAPIPPGEWFLITPVNSLDVSHLKGMEVGLLVDGLVHERQIVDSTGIVTWPEAQATTRAVCGLPYQAQLQTMYLTTGQPTSQGRMKVISQVIIRVTCTLGIKAGVADFLDMYECKETMVIPYSAPPEHFQGDIQMNVGNDWNLYGQVCIQQDYPLPVTVLGVIPQVVIGDDD